MIEEAERLLIESSGRRLVLSDVAARTGLSQSYAHRFFPTKADLIRALASRWFEAVEAECERIARSEAPAQERLRTMILATLRMKRARFDHDPALFLAYLELARDHMDLVRAHAADLSAHLSAVLSEIVPAHAVPAATALVEDATLLFRTPATIAAHRDRATDERAHAVIDALLPRLAAMCGAPYPSRHQTSGRNPIQSP